jgi:outer membrane protein assembly factor BamB
MQFIRTAVLQFSIWLVASGVAVGVLVWRNHYGEHVETTVVDQKQMPNVDRVWYTATGAVIAASRSSQGLDFREVAGGRQTTPGRSTHKLLASTRRDAPYAVSPDGDGIAWANRTTVTVTWPGGDPPISRTVGRKTDITQLAWIDGSVILALHADGNLEALDATNLTARAVIDTELQHASFMTANGTFVAVASRNRDEFRMFDMRMLPQISVSNKQQFSDAFTCLTLSADGRTAACTKAGPVLDGNLITGIGTPTLIEFYDEQRLLVSSNTGMLLLGDPSGPMTVPNVPSAVRSIAVTEGKIAIGSATGVVLLTQRITPPISDAGWWLIWRWLGVTAIIGMFFVVRAVFRRADEARELEEEEEVVDEEHGSGLAPL